MRYKWLVALALLLLPTAALAQNAIRLHWEQYDNIVDVQRDGSLRIREDQTFVVDQGTLSRMTREFETSSAGRVTNIRVSENGVPYERSSSGAPGTYQGSDNGDTAQIQLFFRDPTVDRHDITIEYTVQDALVANADRAQLNWNFFWGTSGAPPIDNGSVVINFPQNIDPASLQVDTAGPQVQQDVTGNTLSLALAEPIQGQQLEVAAAFPRTILAANAQLRSRGQNAQPNTQPNVPLDRNPVPQPAPGIAPAVGFDPIFCFIVMIVLFIAFSVISSSARRRQRGGGYYQPPTYGPDPFGGAPYGRRRRRRQYGGWGWGFPPIIIPPPNIGRDNRPFNGPSDDHGDSGGSGSDWGDSGGSSSGWGDSGGSSSGWGDSGGSSSSWGNMGGGSSSWGGGSGGGNDRGGGGGSGGGSFG